MTRITDPAQIWEYQKGQLLKRYPQLNKYDVRYDYGMKDVMLNNLQRKLGKSREEVNVLLSGL
jgi:hypothetical protein